MRVLKWNMRLVFERVENGLDSVFRPSLNPFYQLGALGWFFYWIVIVSGIYLYVFFDTGVTGAFESVERITDAQWYAGGVMRSLHRYASDALVIVVMVHLVREYAFDRLGGKRWFAWITGVPLLWLLFACGVSGYWLVWDKLAQYVAIATTEWLDTLPFFGEPIARNFLSSSTLSGRFFTLMVFIHIAAPLIMLFVMWLHIQRHARAKVTPPRGLALGTLATMVILSLAYPALSQGPANLDTVPAVVRPDWYYLAVYPLLDYVPGGTLWLVLAAGTVLLCLLPWLPPAPKEPVAVVDLDNCNGCGRCDADCPYSAITMRPRTDGAAYEHQAVVDPSRCTSCGLCVGSCPTATPFRRASDLIPGIDLPQQTVKTLREQVVAAGQHEGAPRIIVFCCRPSATASPLREAGESVVEVSCLGHLPPPFIDFTLAKGHADGVFLAGCRDGDCHYRLGMEWTVDRIACERDPYLRARVDRERLAISWSGPTRSGRLSQDLHAFRERLRLPAAPLPVREAALEDVPGTEGSDAHG